MGGARRGCRLPIVELRFAIFVARLGEINTIRPMITAMFYRRQGIEWGDSTGVYTGNVPSLAPPEMPARRYAFRGHRVPRALTYNKENMYRWSVKDLVAAIRSAPDGDIDYTSKDRPGYDRSKVWKFAGGIWVCDIDNGATCEHGTAAARAPEYSGSSGFPKYGTPVASMG